MGVTMEKEYVVLVSIVDIGGEGTKKKVLDNINDRRYLIFSQDDLKIKSNRNEIKWRNDLAFTRKRLQGNEYIDGTVKNNWKITDKGKEYLFSLTEKILDDNLIANKLTEESIIRASQYYKEYIGHGMVELRKSKEEVSASIIETEYDRFVKMRIGQSIFKNKLLKKDDCCKICGMNEKRLLIASHIKPWSESNNEERLDENNGFLLCPNHDSLFDKGYISFDEFGKIMISSILNVKNFKELNINKEIKIKISQENKKYIVWHRYNVFKK